MNVKVILDSLNKYNGTRLTTFELSYPQTIHQQMLTHRVFSRNSSSLRAISFSRSLDFETVYPIWTEEKKGMVGERLNDLEHADIIDRANEIVDQMRASVEGYCLELASLGIHHQNINDYLRPFQNVHVLLSGTEFTNFFNLRIDDHAKPEIHDLALLMKTAMQESTPVYRLSHIPFALEEGEYNEEKEDLYLQVAAMCARISYVGKGNDESNLALGKKLWANKHLSPFEHIAFADPSYGFFANYRSWIQYRTLKGY